MPHLEDCKGIIRRLIAKGDTNNAPLAERAINEYLLATPVQARKSGLRFLQEDVLAQRNAVLGSPRAIADTIFDYILRGGSVMKYLCEFASEGCAAAAAVLWFVSASIRLKKPNRIRRWLESGLDDPKAVLIMVYRQSRWSAWVAIAAGLAAVFAIADGLLPGT